MLDFGEPQDRRGKKVLSVRSLVEFDCVNQTGRLLAVLFHAGNMGAGDPEWEPTSTTLTQAFWNAACGKP